MIRRATALLCVLAGGAVAQSVEDVSTAVQGWLTKNNAKGVVAIQPPDARVAVIDLGIPVDTQVDLASLSKAITATCMATLVEEGHAKWSDPVSEYVPGFQGFTIGDLVTHESGVTQDATQRYMSVWLDDPQHRAAEIVTQMRARKAPTGPAGSYVYSNDNYALLALVIEAITGRSYEDTCRDRVLTPAGVTAAPSETSGAFLSWGGWSMTVANYLKFHAYGYNTSDGSVSEPTADIGGGAYYGLGMLQRPMRGGSNHWHFGALCFPGRFNVGTFVVAFFNGWRVVVAYDACADWPAMVALDGAIVGAVFQ